MRSSQSIPRPPIRMIRWETFLTGMLDEGGFAGKSRCFFRALSGTETSVPSGRLGHPLPCIRNLLRRPSLCRRFEDPRLDQPDRRHGSALRRRRRKSRTLAFLCQGQSSVHCRTGGLQPRAAHRPERRTRDPEAQRPHLCVRAVPISLKSSHAASISQTERTTRAHAAPKCLR